MYNILQLAILILMTDFFNKFGVNISFNRNVEIANYVKLYNQVRSMLQNLNNKNI